MLLYGLLEFDPLVVEKIIKSDRAIYIHYYTFISFREGQGPSFQQIVTFPMAACLICTKFGWNWVIL